MSCRVCNKSTKFALCKKCDRSLNEFENRYLPGYTGDVSIKYIEWAVGRYKRLLNKGMIS